MSDDIGLQFAFLEAMKKIKQFLFFHSQCSVGSVIKRSSRYRWLNAAGTHLVASTGASYAASKCDTDATTFSSGVLSYFNRYKNIHILRTFILKYALSLCRSQIHNSHCDTEASIISISKWA